jgi:hypothetical protein
MFGYASVNMVLCVSWWNERVSVASRAASASNSSSDGAYSGAIPWKTRRNSSSERTSPSITRSNSSHVMVGTSRSDASIAGHRLRAFSTERESYSPEGAVSLRITPARCSG